MIVQTSPCAFRLCMHAGTSLLEKLHAVIDGQADMRFCPPTICEAFHVEGKRLCLGRAVKREAFLASIVVHSVQSRDPGCMHQLGELSTFNLDLPAAENLSCNALGACPSTCWDIGVIDGASSHSRVVAVAVHGCVRETNAGRVFFAPRSTCSLGREVVPLAARLQTTPSNVGTGTSFLLPPSWADGKGVLFVGWWRGRWCGCHCFARAEFIIC